MTVSRGDAQYTREQKGHSVLFAILICLIGFGIPFVIYWAVSPNHFFHL